MSKKHTVWQRIFNSACTACSARRHSRDNPAFYSDAARVAHRGLDSLHFCEGHKLHQVRSPWRHWSPPVHMGRHRQPSTDQVPGMLSPKPAVYCSRDKLWTHAATPSAFAPWSPQGLMALPSAVDSSPMNPDTHAPAFPRSSPQPLWEMAAPGTRSAQPDSLQSEGLNALPKANEDMLKFHWKGF